MLDNKHEDETGYGPCKDDYRVSGRLFIVLTLPPDDCIDPFASSKIMTFKPIPLPPGTYMPVPSPAKGQG